MKEAVLTDRTSGWRGRAADYLVRSLSITPAAAIGGLLWNIAPQVPFIIAGLIGLVATLVFIMTVEERYAS